MVDGKNNLIFNIIEQFKTFQSLQEKISSNEMEHFVKLCIRDLRSIGAAQQERVKRKPSEEIRYYELTYASIHGGKKFKPRGKGARQTSLVVLLILNSFKNRAKVKIASTSSHSMVRCSTKSRSKAATRGGEVFSKKLLMKFYKIKNK